MTDGAGTTGNAAALDGADDIDLADQIGRGQKADGRPSSRGIGPIIIDITAVDGDGTGAALIDADTGNGGFTAGTYVTISCSRT